MSTLHSLGFSIVRKMSSRLIDTVADEERQKAIVKQAFDKLNFDAMSKLNADYCTGCGHCSFVCPSRIDLKGAVLRSKAMLRQQE